MQPTAPAGGQNGLISILISIIFAVLIFFLITKYKPKYVMKTWFFLVSILALAITINSLIFKISYAPIIAIAIAIPFVILKVYKRNLIAHNFTELLIYPGIAAIFVPLLNFVGVIILLVLISIYDMWAVWKSNVMKNRVNYQMKELKVLGGFMVPYLTKRQKTKFKKMKKDELKKKGLRVQVGMLGGGDVAFSIIAAGVVLKTFGPIAAIITVLGAFTGLTLLMIFSEKKKMYPAMPFISPGIFVAFLINWLIGLI